MGGLGASGADLAKKIEKYRNNLKKNEALTEERFFLKTSNKITSTLKKHLRYFGDWNRENGYHTPRSNSKILETGQGDCKEFALLTVILLRHFNYEKATLALLQRKGIHYDDRINVMIFPSLDAGNIAYKLCQSLGKFRSIGPFLQGFKKPVCDLSRGATTEDIISSSVLTIASI